MKAWGFLGTGTGAELLQPGKPHLDSSGVFGELVSALKLVPAFRVTGTTETQVLPLRHLQQGALRGLQSS